MDFIFTVLYLRCLIKNYLKSGDISIHIMDIFLSVIQVPEWNEVDFVIPIQRFNHFFQHSVIQKKKKS